MYHRLPSKTCVSKSRRKYVELCHGKGCQSGPYLEPVNEDEEQCFAHAHQLRPIASSASSSTPASKRVVVQVDVTAQPLKACVCARFAMIGWLVTGLLDSFYRKIQISHLEHDCEQFVFEHYFHFIVPRPTCLAQWLTSSFEGRVSLTVKFVDK